ncbi:MAG: heme-copper oxidase subunit III [Promethearchaeota archaeon]
MAEIHPITVHFHIAFFTFSVFATVGAVILSLVCRFKIHTKINNLNEETIYKYIDHLEFGSFFAIVLSIIDVPVAGLAGLLDASGRIGEISLDALIEGVDKASQSSLISYKMNWAIVGTFYFVFVAAMRVYYVNYRKERIYDQNILIQLVYVINQIIGYLFITLVGGTGAILVFGGTTIQDIPVIKELLSGGDIDPIYLVVLGTGLSAICILGSSFLKPAPAVIPDESTEHETSLWPPILGLGTGLAAYAIFLISQDQIIIALAFMWIFIILILAFVFKETYYRVIPKTEEYSWIWYFLASEVLFFSIIIGTSFSLRLGSHHWEDPSEVLNVPLTAVNTFILIISSFTMVKAVDFIRKNNSKMLTAFLGLTILFGATFLSIQVIEYLALFGEGHTPDINLFWSTFYLQTGFHGAHVFVGLLLLSFITLKAIRGGYTLENHIGVELVGIYWHFVDLVWIILFTLIYLID